MKKLLIALLLGLVVLLAVVVGTPQGLRWLIAGAQRVVPGELSISHAAGSLLGSLDLEGVLYRDDAVQVRVESLALDWRPAALLGARLHVRHVRAGGIDVQILKAPEPPAAEPLKLKPLPVAIELDELSLSGISVLEYGATVPVVVDTLHLAATGKENRLQIQAFSVAAPMYAAQARGLLYLDAEQQGDITTDWWVQLPDMPRLAGTGTVQGNVRQLHVSQNITGPATVTVQGSVQDVLERLAWNAQVEIGGFNLQVLQPQGPERQVEGTLTGSGGVDAFTIQGNTRLTDPAFGLITADLQLSRTPGNWRLERMELRKPEQQGALRVNGEYTTNGKLSARAEWSELAWQLNEQQSLRSASGEVVLEGTLDEYRFSSRGVLESTGYPLLTFTAQGTGNLQQVELSRLRGDSTQGTFDTSGVVGWQPELHWQVTAGVDGFDPAFFAPDWPGKVSLRLDSQGSQLEQGLEGRLAVGNVAGTLRGQPLTGKANASFHKDTFNITDLQFAAGTTQVSASGSLDAAWDMQWNLAAQDLGLLLPGATGALQGHGRLTGPRDTPRIIAALDGSEVRLQGVAVRSLQARIDVDLADRQVSEVDIRGAGVEASGQSIDSITLTGAGKRPRHGIQFALQQDKQEVTGRLTAILDDKRWSGVLEDMQVQLRAAQTWTLQQPAAFSADRTLAEVQPLCMIQGTARICAGGGWQSSSGWHAALDGDSLPLAQFMPRLDENITVEGEATVELRGQSDANGLLGTARLEVSPGSITLDDGEETLLLTHFMQGHLTARLQNNVLTGELDLPLQDNGGLSGQARLTNVVSRGGWFTDQTAIASDFQLHFADQGLVSLFVPSLSTSKGQMDAELAIGGTLGDPLLSGNATLKNAEVSLPQIGIQLKDVNMQASGAGNTIDLQGSVTSGAGVAVVTGALEIRQGAPFSMDLSLTGDNVQVVNIPEAMALASPDLKLSLREKRLDITGAVRIPDAQIRLRELKGVARESGDLVLVRQEEVIPQADKYQVFSRVNVILDDKVSFDGFGLSGKLAGKVEILEQPGKVTRGQGELNIIDGQYKLYGTELDIEKGRLVFAGGPIGNPGLEMRVVRKTGDVLAGVRVTGTAETPKLNLFSDPAMEQSDVLSYLLLGIPTSKASGAQGAALSGAAASLGLTGGDWLANKLGGAFGLEEMRIESGESVEESSLVLGKYLSPRMYISYAVGLFDQLNTFRIRYSLSKRWAVQTEAGVATGADLLFSMER
ncbi:MAG: translocation/assembly module TamB domain-containing protein [Gammaproteobacteria bacterium]